ncbi:hypothetical protein ACTI_48760 [Actinoplanes sp. OR16]|nr:hypothetical protein ACTI_48760 [Actinoplanes sp. OR16]
MRGSEVLGFDPTGRYALACQWNRISQEEAFLRRCDDWAPPRSPPAWPATIRDQAIRSRPLS